MLNALDPAAVAAEELTPEAVPFLRFEAAAQVECLEELGWIRPEAVRATEFSAPHLVYKGT